MNMKNKKRISLILAVSIVISLLLVVRLIYVQIIKYDHYSELAYKQQTRERTVTPKRGTIYDATGSKILAQSISVNVISAVPSNVEDKEAVATKLAELLSKNKEDILTKLNKKTSSEVIASKVDKETGQKVLQYISDEDIVGLRVDEDTKRMYPYNSMLSHALGFVGTDNQGLSGIEAYYNEDLEGVPGKIVGSTDGQGRETPFTNEQYVAPVDGNDMVLTIDATIQNITEKYLRKAYKENSGQYATAIVLRPKTGEVLAMATMPDFNPNDPFTPNTDDLLKSWDSLSKEERSNSLNSMWRNKAISDTAEPGSTFKIVTASAALEENVTSLDVKGDFNCSGSMQISGWTIKCWRSPRSHGSESLREGIMNSCNPVFMQVSQRLGVEAYCKYLEAFNLNYKTGIDLPGEATGIMHNPSQMNAVDLATTSFGQTIQITPIQTAVNYAAIANGGYLVKPYVVKELKSVNGSFEKTTQSQVVKQIISKTTADGILSALEDTVKTGTGKAGQVRGYRVAGKTGTAEEGRGASSVYMASFVGIAPVNDPEVVVYVAIYDPKGPLGHQGSTVCAPVAGSIIDETLRYLDIKPDYTLEQNNIKEILIPNLVGKTVAEGNQTLKDLGFKLESDQNLKNEEVIKDQIPKAGASLMEGSSVRVYVNDDAKQTVAVSDVRNKKTDVAISTLRNSGLNVRVIGWGYVLTQDPANANVIEKGSIVTIKCVDTTDLP